MVRSDASTGRRAAGALAFASLLLSACGGDGAGGGAGFSQTPPPDGGGGGTPVTATVAVSQAVPAGGNGLVTVGPGASAQVQPNLRRVRFDGVADTGRRHRIVVDYDVATGDVAAVLHEWDDAAGGVDAAVQCTRAVVPGVVQRCQGATVDLAAARVTFAGTRLRGATGGTPAELAGTSVLSAAGLPFTPLP